MTASEAAVRVARAPARISLTVQAPTFLWTNIK